ncbi:MAG: deoxyribose-phosphate aldolase [Thermoplasmatales archaeon]|nr:deoxyribose-phosphate aldolase [Thermoplasmatales archaeon]
MQEKGLMCVTKRQLEKMIDSTNLRPDATADDIKKLCYDAKKHNFWSVCVNPCFVSLASDLLISMDVKVCTVIGFPFGAATPESKIFEVKDAVRNGADEIDMVINIGALKDKKYEAVKKEIKDIVDVVGKVAVKVIIETCYLTDEEKIKACQIAKEAGAHFVKTSTGFGPKGATAEDVALMRKTVGPNMGVKASGGIRTIDDAVKMINAGANRIGTSNAVEIVEGIGQQKLLV